MAQYINKDALVAEIERIKEDALQKKGQCKRRGLERIMHQIGAYNKILSFLDTLEVREVDLEKVFNDEYSKFSNDVGADYAFPIDLADFKDFAKHFFALGMAVNNKSQKGK